MNEIKRRVKQVYNIGIDLGGTHIAAGITDDNGTLIIKDSVPTALPRSAEVPVVVNSDAHSCFSVGDVKASLALLQDIDFPQELVINQKLERLAQWIFKKRSRNIL